MRLQILATLMACRQGCGACCIAPSINRPYYGMPNGKPAGTPCVHLNMTTKHCAIWATPNYPSTCQAFIPEPFVCGTNREEAITLISEMESETLPVSLSPEKGV